MCRVVTWRFSLKIAAPSYFHVQREKTHNFSGVLKNVCGGVCFSSFFVNLQANKPCLCWKDICYTVIFQGFCEYIFKLFGSTCLFGAHCSEWLLPGCGKCTGQERCVKICAKEGNIFLFAFVFWGKLFCTTFFFFFWILLNLA